MNKVPKHPQEDLRILSLEDLKILDTLPEKEFDEITFLAAQLCGTSMSFISFVDKNRQWFKSKYGFEFNQIPRDTAFCSYAILRHEPTIITDCHADERFLDNPLVTGDSRIKFYAGIPLNSPDGLPIGTLCVADKANKNLSEHQIKCLQTLSIQVTRLFELKIQNESLKASTEALTYKSIILDSISEGIMLLDKSGAIVDCNPAAAEFLGVTREQLLGAKTENSDWINITEDGHNFPVDELPTVKCLRTAEKQSNVVMGVRHIFADTRWLNINSRPLFLHKEDEHSHVVTSFSDITTYKKLQNDRRELEGKLSDSSRLSALGEMAGGLAHEINNPLAILLGKSSILKAKLLNGGLTLDDVKSFDKIESTIERIAKVIRGLRTYARNADSDPFIKGRMTDIITDTVELCATRFRNAGVKFSIESDVDIEIDCRPSQISQLIMNILNNSFDAIADLKDKWITIRVQDYPESTKIIFSDSGHGIPDALVSKIMQPFYSTKEVGKGMGLGLSISKGIAESHGGTFKYDEQAINTSFILVLPKSQQQRKVA